MNARVTFIDYVALDKNLFLTLKLCCTDNGLREKIITMDGISGSWWLFISFVTNTISLSHESQLAMLIKHFADIRYCDY